MQAWRESPGSSIISVVSERSPVNFALNLQTEIAVKPSTRRATLSLLALILVGAETACAKHDAAVASPGTPHGPVAHWATWLPIDVRQCEIDSSQRVVRTSSRVLAPVRICRGRGSAPDRDHVETAEIDARGEVVRVIGSWYVPAAERMREFTALRDSLTRRLGPAAQQCEQSFGVWWDLGDSLRVVIDLMPPTDIQAFESGRWLISREVQSRQALGDRGLPCLFIRARRHTAKMRLA